MQKFVTTGAQSISPAKTCSTVMDIDLHNDTKRTKPAERKYNDVAEYLETVAGSAEAVQHVMFNLEEHNALKRSLGLNDNTTQNALAMASNSALFHARPVFAHMETSLTNSIASTHTSQRSDRTSVHGQTKSKHNRELSLQERVFDISPESHSGTTSPKHAQGVDDLTTTEHHTALNTALQDTIDSGQGSASPGACSSNSESVHELIAAEAQAHCSMQSSTRSAGCTADYDHVPNDIYGVPVKVYPSNSSSVCKPEPPCHRKAEPHRMNHHHDVHSLGDNLRLPRNDFSRNRPVELEYSRRQQHAKRYAADTRAKRGRRRSGHADYACHRWILLAFCGAFLLWAAVFFPLMFAFKDKI